MRKIEIERIERAARVYASNEEASRALGIAPGSFSRLCRLHKIETPYARKRRQRQQWHRRHQARRLRAGDLDTSGLDPGELGEILAELDW